MLFALCFLTVPCFPPEMCPIYCLSYSTFWSLVDLFFRASLSFKITRASKLLYGVPIGWNGPLSKTVCFPHSGCCWIFLRDTQPFHNTQLLISITVSSFSLQTVANRSLFWTKTSASLWVSTHYHGVSNTGPELLACVRSQLSRKKWKCR